MGVRSSRGEIENPLDPRKAQEPDLGADLTGEGFRGGLSGVGVLGRGHPFHDSIDQAPLLFLGLSSDVPQEFSDRNRRR